MYAALLKFSVPLLALAAVFGLLWMADQRGYARAQRHYEPILAQFRTHAEQAEKRAKAAESAAATINDVISTEDKRRAESAIRQRDAAAVELAGMRVRLSAALTRRCEVSGVPAGPGSADAAAGDDERFRAADQRLADLARSCQRDADRLRGWQDWYGRQAVIRAE